MDGHCRSTATILKVALTGAVILTLGMTSSPSDLRFINIAAATIKRPLPTTPAETPPALVAFAQAWKGVTSYNATITIFEQKGTQTQNMVFDYRFTKPSSVATRVIAGANTGARLAWEGGTTVLVRRGSGILSLFKKTLSLHDPLVTTIRGSTVDQLS